MGDALLCQTDDPVDVGPVAIIMVLGGLMSLSDRRYRVGAPARSTKTVHTVPAE